MDINSVIERIICSRYEHIDYSFINKVANQVIHGMKYPTGYWQNEAETKINVKKTLLIAEDFYKTIDEELYTKVKDIIEGKDMRVKLKIVKISAITDRREPRVYTGKDGKQEIDMFFSEDFFDIYDLVHELAHTLDMPEGKWNLSRVLFSEITSECIEKMFDTYVYDTHICTPKDIQAQKNNNAIRMYDSAKEFSIKYAFMNRKLKSGRLEASDIEAVLRYYNISFDRALRILNANNQDIHHSAKYVVAGIASEQFEDIYKNNRYDSIDRFKTYINLIKQDKGVEAINVLGIDISNEGINKSINLANSHFFSNDITEIPR